MILSRRERTVELATGANNTKLHSDIDFDVLARHTDLQVYGRETR